MGSFKSIYTDYACEPSQTLVGPKLTLEANAAGSLEFSVLPEQDGYDNTYTRPRHGYLVVLKDGEPIWDGRVTTRDMDWNNTKSIYAEGALSYLNDIMIQSLEDTSDFKTARANAKTDLKKKNQRIIRRRKNGKMAVLKELVIYIISILLQKRIYLVLKRIMLIVHITQIYWTQLMMNYFLN